MLVRILLRIGEMLSLKPKTYQLNKEYLVKVSELMKPRLRKPKLKPRVLWGDGEILPIILIDTKEKHNEP